MEMVSFPKQHKDTAGLYWLTKALGHGDDRRFQARHIWITDKDDASMAVVTDGLRLHIYDTNARQQEGFYSVVRRRKTFMQLHREMEYDTSLFPDYTKILVGEGERVKLPRSERGQACWPYSAIIKAGVLVNYSFVLDAMTPYTDHTMSVTDNESPVFIRSSRRLAVIMPMRV